MWLLESTRKEKEKTQSGIKRRKTGTLVGAGGGEGRHPDEEHQVINGGGKLAGTSETNEVINKEGKTTRAERAKLENTEKKSAKPDMTVKLALYEILMSTLVTKLKAKGGGLH